MRNNYQNYNCKTKTQINIQEIQEMLKKGAIKLVQPNTKRQYLSSIFIVPKKRLLNKLNKHIPYILFKMESLFLLKETLLRLLVQNRPKRCIFFGTTKSKSPKIVSFKCKVLIYQFLCLCFGLGPAPKIITKLLKVPISLMRKLNVRLTIFLDDILLMAASVE